MKKFKTLITVLLLIITFFLVVFFTFTRIHGETPTLFGYQILRVVSPSMEPKLMVGDIILSHKLEDAKDLQLGDIITYKGEYGEYEGKLITHEVVTEPYESEGKYYLQTKGFANNYPDPEISDDQIVGIMIKKMPFLSTLYSFFSTIWGLIFILVFLAILFINEIINLFRLFKEKELAASAGSDENNFNVESDNNTNTDL